SMILRDLRKAAHVRADFRLIENAGVIEASCLVMRDGFAHLENISATDHLRDGTETELRHDFAYFLRNEPHEVRSVFRVAGEFLPQFRILCGDTDRAGIQMADAHHDTAERHQWRRCETEFLGAK